MKRLTVMILLLAMAVTLFAGCAADPLPTDPVGGAGQEEPAGTQGNQEPEGTQSSAELTEEMIAMLQGMGVSLEEFNTFSPEKQQAILAELGIVAGDREEQGTQPSRKEYTTADVAAGGKFVVYIGDSLGWNYFLLHYENGKLVKVETHFQKSSEEEPDEQTFEGDTLQDFQYIDKSLDELIDYFDQKDYGYETRIEAVK